MKDKKEYKTLKRDIKVQLANDKAPWFENECILSVFWVKKKVHCKICGVSKVNVYGKLNAVLARTGTIDAYFKNQTLDVYYKNSMPPPACSRACVLWFF